MSVLALFSVAGWYTKNYIETVVQPRQQAAKLALIDEQIATAIGLFERGDYESALGEYAFVLSAYERDMPPAMTADLNDRIGRCHVAAAQAQSAKPTRAEASYRAALEAFDRSLDYRTPHNDLDVHVATALRRAEALQAVGRLRSDDRDLELAISAYGSILERIGQRDMAVARSSTHRQLGNAYRDLNLIDANRFDMQAALDQYDRALATVAPLEHPDAHAAALQDLARAYVVLARLKYRRRHLETAVEHLESALGQYDRKRAPRQHAETQLLIGDTYTMLAQIGPKNRSDRASHQQRKIRYENKAKQAYRVAQAFGLTPRNGVAVDDPVTIVDIKK
ncbi:MAG: hypothetical protein ACR2RL_16975 [Gammaproteobacteria bacterium]